MRVLAVIFVVVVVAAVFSYRAGSARPTLEPLAPPLPELTNMERSLQVKLREVAAAVDAQPEWAEAWGRLGGVLDVHDITEEALICYERARLLDPADYRWPYFIGYRKRVGDQQGALESFRRAAKLKPDYAPIHVYLGEGYLRSEQIGEAEAAFQRAADLDPTLVRAQIGLAKVALAKSELEVSLGHLQTAVGLGPTAGEAYFLLADVHRRLGDTVDAEKNANLAEGRRNLEPLPDPTRDALWWRDGVSLRWRRARSAVHTRKGEIQKAIAEWQEALRYDSESTEVLFELGLAHSQTGQLEEALRYYDRAIAIKPSYAKAQQNRGLVLMGLKREDEAQQALENALKLDPKLPEALNNLGALLIGKGGQDHVVEGLKLLRQACEIDPKNPDVHFNLAMSLIKYLPREALKEFERAIELAPGNLRMWFEYGVLNARMKRFSEAAQAFQKVVAGEPERLVAHVNLGRALQKAGQCDAAIETFERALKIFPDHPRLLNRIAWIYATSPDVSFRNGDQALTIARTLCEKSNYKNPEELDTLAAALAEVGNFEQATHHAKLALDLVDKKDPTKSAYVHEIFGRYSKYQKEIPFFDEP